MKNISEMNELELSTIKKPWPKSAWQLGKLIYQLINRKHDYGTCVYAMSLSAIATFNYVASKLGVTGFQASCADLDFIGRSKNMEHGFKILDYNDLFYPQLLYRFDKTISKGIMKALQDRAVLELQKESKPHPNVQAYWEKLAEGYPPDGFIIEEES